MVALLQRQILNRLFLTKFNASSWVAGFSPFSAGWVEERLRGATAGTNDVLRRCFNRLICRSRLTSYIVSFLCLTLFRPKFWNIGGALRRHWEVMKNPGNIGWWIGSWQRLLSCFQRFNARIVNYTFSFLFLYITPSSFALVVSPSNVDQ